MKEPLVVYYLHYADERHMERDYNKRQDFAACVMAESQAEAIEKVKIIANNPYIKICGIAKGREDWVNEKYPMGHGEEIMPQGGWPHNKVNRHYEK